MGTRAIYRGRIITKSPDGYVVNGNVYPTLTAATAAIR